MLAPLAWLAFVAAPRSCLPSACRPPPDDADVPLDTDGIAYTDVPAVKKYETEAYICPKLTKEVVAAARKAMTQFQIAIGYPAETAQADDDAFEQQQSSLFSRLKLGIDDLISSVLE